jgi:uncharacterized protein
MTVFVDSSMLYAAADSGDTSAERAREILGGERRLVSSDHVLVECWRLLRDRLSWDAAERFWSGLRFGPASIEAVSERDLETAWQIGRAFSDQEFSLVDRTSFAVMERLGIARAASFDDDFAIYRFGPKRDRAFEIVR